MPILIAEATEEAVRLALLRHWCAAVRDRRPPHEDLPDQAAALAGQLARALNILALLRGTRRDARGYRRRAAALTARLAAVGLEPPR